MKRGLSLLTSWTVLERWVLGLVFATALAASARAEVCNGYAECVRRMAEAADIKDYPAAQAAAEAALALRQEPVLLLNLGTFHERQQHSTEALDFCARYLKNPGPELTPERREKLERRIATLRQALILPRHTADRPPSRPVDADTPLSKPLAS